MAWMKRWILRLRLYRLAGWLYEGLPADSQTTHPRRTGGVVAATAGDAGGSQLPTRTVAPRGWINRGETARMAAQRELAEELGLQVDANKLGEPWAFTERSARGLNTVTIFSVELAERPRLQVDGLEILSCLWLTRTEVLEHPITGHLRAYLLEKPDP